MYELTNMLDDPTRRRTIPHRMAAAGYDQLPNPDRTDGLWRIAGRRVAVYGRRDLPFRFKVEAARGLRE